MTALGIERIGFYGGRAAVEVREIGRLRGLDLARFDNLLLRRKTVHFPWEDPVSFAVNAARPLLDGLPAGSRARIDHLLVASESGIDFGKSLATWVHPLLDLPRHCRLFEVKQACYGGTAALQSALGMLALRGEPGRKALLICADIARPIPGSYAEPTQAGAAVALLVGDEPEILSLEPGASGVYGHHVMDACRPDAEQETGDADLSLLTYLDCLEQSFAAYRARVGGDVSFRDHFAYLAFHTPFGGMVKGAHRRLLRRLEALPPAAIEADFYRRLAPSLTFCQEVGNIYSGTLFLALAGVIASGDFREPRRVGLFSYGSGCCAEFFSGLAGASAPRALDAAGIAAHLAERRPLDRDGYERVLQAQRQGQIFGRRNAAVEPGPLADLFTACFAGRGLCVLDRVENYERRYRWS